MIAYRVVAVPERLQRANMLAEAVHGDVILDAMRVGTLTNHVRALQSAGDATHVVVLEDDAIVCNDFVAHVARLIMARPNHLIGLYVGRVAPRKPQPVIEELVKAEPAWLDHPDMQDKLRWAVGYVMPVADIPDVIASLPANPHKWLDADKKLGAWHAHHGSLSYPFPSPVDHDDTVRSTTSKHGRGRVAWTHCGGVG